LKIISPIVISKGVDRGKYASESRQGSPGVD
jgi:hypothetical protein